MRIAVIGSGYVGLVSATCFAEIGHNVISVDNDNAKIAALERGEVPIHERFLPELLQRHRGQRLRFSTSVAQAVKQSDSDLYYGWNATIGNRGSRFVVRRSGCL